jgi:hypothetical protein
MQYSELNAPEAELVNISNVNIILGRNGAGKSRFLRELDTTLSGNSTNYNVRYISPERAGVFRRDGNIQNNMENNHSWLRDTRRRNQADQFKAASANLLREIKIIYLRKVGELQPTGPVLRFRLNCYAIENTLMSDECLQLF